MNKNTTSKMKNELNGKECHTHAESEYAKSKNKAGQSASKNSVQDKAQQQRSESCYGRDSYTNSQDNYGKNCGR